MDFRAGLMPEDKVKAVMALNNEHHTMMVGDGITDAPQMKAASIGVAMGSGTDAALETADAALISQPPGPAFAGDQRCRGPQ